MSIRRRAIRLANALEEAPRTENDLETAAILRQLVRVHEVAHEVVLAKTHEASKAAYCELIDLIKGKTYE
jgi:hypothetical protein